MIHAGLVTELPALAGHVSVHSRLDLLTCRSRDALVAHDLATLLNGTSAPTSFPVPWPDARIGAAIAPGRDLAVFSGPHALRAVEPSGRTRWELGHVCWSRRCRERHTEPPQDDRHRFNDLGSAHFTEDGALVWAHVLDVDGDEWIVVDAASGEVLARAATNTDAHGSWHYPHPSDPARMALALGEGQDAVPLLWGHFDGSALHVRRAGEDRIVADVHGEHYLTTGHYDNDLALHRLADDTVVAKVGPPTFEGVAEADAVDDDRSHWSTVAGFLDERTAIACTNEENVERGPNRHWLLDLPGMSVRGPVVYPERVEGRPLALGSGRWITLGGRGAKVWE